MIPLNKLLYLKEKNYACIGKVKVSSTGTTMFLPMNEKSMFSILNPVIHPALLRREGRRKLDDVAPKLY